MHQDPPPGRRRFGRGPARATVVMGLVAALATLAGARGGPLLAQRHERPRAGRPAATKADEALRHSMRPTAPLGDFALAPLGGGPKVRLSDLKGKVVLVSFWYPG